MKSSRNKEGASQLSSGVGLNSHQVPKKHSLDKKAHHLSRNTSSSHHYSISLRTYHENETRFQIPTEQSMVTPATLAGAMSRMSHSQTGKFQSSENVSNQHMEASDFKNAITSAVESS